MKKVILSAVLAAMVLSISGCQDSYKERKQDYKKPDINRPGNPQRFEKF